jgi:hypothetical protein
VTSGYVEADAVLKHAGRTTWVWEATNTSYYDPQAGVGQHISYTNMPYVLNAGLGCGEGLVNQPGTLDGFSIALGHEVQETVTDPGAEEVVGNITNGGSSYYGGWYDQLDGDENGDKCAYVGAVTSVIGGAPGLPSVLPIPGALHDMTGNQGGRFAVQSLWSNTALGGIGYCDG